MPDRRDLSEIEEPAVNPSDEACLEDIAHGRLSRRSVLGQVAAVSFAALGAVTAWPGYLRARESSPELPPFSFEEIHHGVDETHHVPPGYETDILIRWGDPVAADAPPFDPHNQSPEAQAKQFGYNNDYLALMPVSPGVAIGNRALLCVNHEYTNAKVMFPGITRREGMAKTLVDVEMAAHGISVLAIARNGQGRWDVVRESPLARRITGTDVMSASGPAAGHDRLKTSADRSGKNIIGTLINCAGGVTPWGTYLTAEENFHFYFGGRGGGGTEERSHKRYGVPHSWFSWHEHYGRFDVAREPNEANRFGWIVEVDPYDPRSTPIKRTALGRFKHEGAEAFVNGDGRVVIYSGDDQRFEYIYRFVSRDRLDPENREKNRDLLDRGTLSVARFEVDGSLAWLPLVFGEGPLTPVNDFHSQADVLIETRRAADLWKATPMDRPEDIETCPRTGKVYVMLTRNRKRGEGNAANPRTKNDFGHIVELVPPGGDHGAVRYRWEMFVQCGDADNEAVGATWHPLTSSSGWFASPDNCAFDPAGRLWVTSDQGPRWRHTGTADGLWAILQEGPLRGLSRMFFRAPVGAEVTGPAFSPDGRSLFLSVQHPGIDGARHYKPFGRRASFADPPTRWPDFKEAMPPRPAVVVVRRKGGGAIGV